MSRQIVSKSVTGTEYSEGGINIEMITTSEIRITCIVEEDKVGVAARVLHDAFELEKED